MEAAKVLWMPEPEMVARPPGSQIIPGGRDRQFESVENAVRFVMEDLSEYERGNAIIQTDSGTIHRADIEAMYAQQKAGETE